MTSQPPLRYSQRKSPKFGETPLRHQSQKSLLACSLALGWLGCVLLAGCQSRAYSDLYAESMAAEIRDLEDQLYEYDHQYQRLEQETEMLRQQNLRLKSEAAASSSDANPAKRSLLSPSNRSGKSSRDYSPLEFQPRPSGVPITPEPILDVEQIPLQPNSILEPSSSPGSPLQGSTAGQTPRDSTTNELPAPDRAPKQPLDSSAPATPTDGSNLPRFPAPSNSGESDVNGEGFEELMPPTIDPGVPSPPPLPAVSQRADGTPVPLEDDLEMNLTRIEIPVPKIPGQKIPATLAGDRSISQATLQVASEKINDTRVVELAFHPTLSRAIDMDDRPDDDGLYLVLQPKNERGQMVPVVADLIIFALDPARDEENSKIGRWEYSAADLREKLQPIGSEQGIHLRLPWNGPDPSADRVIVFALFKFENGKQVMGEKEIYISSDGSHKTVWAPRASPQVRSDNGTTVGVSQSEPPPAVAQAGFMATSPSPPVANRPSAPHANPVVRPASGTDIRQPPPMPH